VGFSFVLNRGSGRRAHTLTGAEGQATEAAATMAADLEECVPRDFFWEIFLAQKNFPPDRPDPFQAFTGGTGRPSEPRVELIASSSSFTHG